MDETLTRELVLERVMAAQQAAFNDELEMWARERAHSLMLDWLDMLDCMDGKFQFEGGEEDEIPLVS